MGMTRTSGRWTVTGYPAITAAVALLLALGCGGEATTPSRPDEPTALDAGPFVVSNAITGQAASAAATPSQLRLSASRASSVAYVSLPPGSIPDATSATITTTSGSGSVTAFISDGGFDPVAVPAEAGDTLLIQVQGTAAAKITYRVPVRPKSRPVVVRTSPPKHKRDVPLNYLIRIVFSEPMDSTTLDRAVTLTINGARVPGQINGVNSSGVVLEATFKPDELLEPQTYYVVHVDTTAGDLGGELLAVPVAAEFTTGDTFADTAAVTPPDTASPTVAVLRPAPGDTVAGNYLSMSMHVEAPNGLAEIHFTANDFEWTTLYFSEPKSFSDDATLFVESEVFGTLTLTVSVTDSFGRVGTSQPVTIEAVTPDTTPRIIVRSFVMLEVDGWSYTPQIVVADAPGGTGLHIIGFELLTLPGLPSPFPRIWASGLEVPPGQDVSLVGEMYGDWEFGFYGRESQRSDGGMATARLTYRDDTGHIYAARLEGPIVPGALPTTYSGHCSHWLGGFSTYTATCPLSLIVRSR